MNKEGEKSGLLKLDRANEILAKRSRANESQL